MQAKQDTHSELFSHHRSSLKWTWHPFRLVRFAVPCAAKESSDDGCRRRFRGTTQRSAKRIESGLQSTQPQPLVGKRPF